MKYGKYNVSILFLILFVLCIACINYTISIPSIPIVIIAYNNLYFVRNFINQLKQFKNQIILFDNNSSYKPLLDYYTELKNELGSQIDIRLLNENYGSNVYLKLAKTLPKVFILSDCDLQLNPEMPQNFTDILYKLSNKYKAYKVGLALDISDKDKFIKCDKYIDGHSIYEWELQFWENPISDDTYRLYKAETDTTFCLINNNYIGGQQIRIANEFTAKHLPWYKNYIKDHIPATELKSWKNDNNSSGILLTCNID